MNPIQSTLLAAALPLCALAGLSSLAATAGCGASNETQTAATPAAAPRTVAKPAPAYVPPSGVMNEQPNEPPSEQPTVSPQVGINPSTGEAPATPPSSSSAQGMPPSTGGGVSGAPTAGSQATLTDEQVAAVVGSINRAEQREALLAWNKGKDTKVKQLAVAGLTAYRDSNARLAAITKSAKLNPEAGMLSAQLDDATMAAVDGLRAKGGASFDRAYVDEQVRMCTQALDVIDTSLLPSVKNEALRGEIQSIRASLADRLRRAQDIQATLAIGPSNNPTNKQPIEKKKATRPILRDYPRP